MESRVRSGWQCSLLISQQKQEAYQNSKRSQRHPQTNGPRWQGSSQTSESSICNLTALLGGAGATGANLQSHQKMSTPQKRAPPEWNLNPWGTGLQVTKKDAKKTPTVLGSLRNDRHTVPPRRMGLHWEMETKLISRSKIHNIQAKRGMKRREIQRMRGKGEKTEGRKALSSQRERPRGCSFQKLNSRREYKV